MAWTETGHDKEFEQLMIGDNIYFFHRVCYDMELSTVPTATKQILEKVHGNFLQRKAIMASILRRILLPCAITDVSCIETFGSIENLLRNLHGSPTTNIVAVSMVPENLNNPTALG